MAKTKKRKSAAKTVVVVDQTVETADLFGSAPKELPVLPIRNAVLFPGTVVPLSIRREASRAMLSDLLPDGKVFLAVTQKDPAEDSPAPDDLYPVGTAMMVLKLLRGEDGSQTLIAQGLYRVAIDSFTQKEPYYIADTVAHADKVRQSTKLEALMLNVRQQAHKVIELAPGVPEEAAAVLVAIDSPGELSDFIAANLNLKQEDKQELLAERSVTKRLSMLIVHLQRQIEVLEISGEIQESVREKVDKTQREYILNEQLKAIRKELGEEDDQAAEIERLTKLIAEAKMPTAVQKEAVRQLGRMKKMPASSPDYGVLQTYLEVMCELPWSVRSDDTIDVPTAKGILEADHYGLQKVKRRILEYLAVRKLAPDAHGPILCFVGPPGVGKTSLGQSIARSLGRKFIRMSLGGMHDEAELRGHRRTYIGAMPGRIIQELRKAGVKNPVYMLDEVDKLASDFRGDPTSAMLEILDPAQNSTFQDNYLNVAFDLSEVLFIATANYLGNIPAPLRDRMEIIEISGYTTREKLMIAKRYLVKRMRKENGLKARQIKFDDASLVRIIEQYTREAGVRELQRQIGSVCRFVAAKIAMGKSRGRVVTKRLITECLGPRKYTNEVSLRRSTPGVATGLAYTSVGGCILFVESTTYPGKGVLRVTGQLGDVMKESAQAAISLIRSRGEELGIPAEVWATNDLHIHVPEGAVPKDGPSAGVTMVTSIVSLLTGRCVRKEVAMTGEITLRGLVLPIGGLKEKVLAAKRAGITEIIIPWENKKDLVEIPKEAQRGLTFHPAKTIEDVLEVALEKKRAKK